MRHRHFDRALVVVASIVMCHGCTKRAGQPAALQDIAVSTADSAGVHIVTISRSVSTLPEWTVSDTPITDVSGMAPPFIGKVGEVAFFGKHQLLVVDRMTSTLWLFGADGRALRRLGGRGDGPGEFRAITQLSVTAGDTIYAFDHLQNRISVFDPDGALQTTISVPGEEFAGPGTFAIKAWVLDSDRILQYGRRLGSDEANSQTGPARRITRDGIIQIIADDGSRRTSPIELRGESYVRGEGYLVSSPFSRRAFVAVNGNRILFNSGRTYDLVLRDFDLRPRMIVRWPGWEAAPKDSLVEAMRAEMQASFDRSRDKLASRLPPAAVGAMVRENGRMMKDLFAPPILPDTLPALSSALLDEDGRIWVARFRTPEDMPLVQEASKVWHQEDMWHVLGPEGKPIARVRLPPDTRLVAVRSDRVIVVTRDDSDVESVRVLAINKTTH